MALWNDKDKDSTPAAAPAPARTHPVSELHPRAPEKAPEPLAAEPKRPPARPEAKESLIAAELTIEGRIEGTGNVRLAGRFKGDVAVQGDVSIDPGARVEGGVQARTVVVGGELTGNIDKAKHVDVLQTGVVVGDVKAETITVAAGSRMRGHVEFGWGEVDSMRPASRSSTPGA
ncbi:MAG TPA: polymer-forming cytoskeletal protein [Steroidobacteraceae bacterium]|nr:polymer-forming cytoskeletal protein [Steroidobacteraceae bacterium]